jgi:hypothetical protein
MAIRNLCLMRETKLRFLTVPVQERFNQLVLEGRVFKKIFKISLANKLAKKEKV